MADTHAQIKCKACGISFEPRCPRNVFCNRKCFKKYFYHKKKAEELANIKFPVFVCPNCLDKIELDFDPVKNGLRWIKFNCPHCNILMINVCEYITTEDKPN